MAGKTNASKAGSPPVPKGSIAYRRHLIMSDEVVAGLGDLRGRFSASPPDEGRSVTLTYKGQNRVGNDLAVAAGRLRSAGFDPFQLNSLTLMVARPTGYEKGTRWQPVAAA